MFKIYDEVKYYNAPCTVVETYLIPEENMVVVQFDEDGSYRPVPESELERA